MLVFCVSVFFLQTHKYSFLNDIDKVCCFKEQVINLRVKVFSQM